MKRRRRKKNQKLIKQSNVSVANYYRHKMTLNALWYQSMSRMVNPWRKSTGNDHIVIDSVKNRTPHHSNNNKKMKYKKKKKKKKKRYELDSVALEWEPFKSFSLKINFVLAVFVIAIYFIFYISSSFTAQRNKWQENKENPVLVLRIDFHVHNLRFERLEIMKLDDCYYNFVFVFIFLLDTEDKKKTYNNCTAHTTRYITLMKINKIKYSTNIERWTKSKLLSMYCVLYCDALTNR